MRSLTWFLGLLRSVPLLRWSAHDFSCCKRSGRPVEFDLGTIEKPDMSIVIERTFGVEVFFSPSWCFAKTAPTFHASARFDKIAQLVITTRATCSKYLYSPTCYKLKHLKKLTTRAQNSFNTTTCYKLEYFTTSCNLVSEEQFQYHFKKELQQKGTWL